MVGFRFYLEYATPAAKRRREHSGNAIAIGVPVQIFAGTCEALVALYDWPNSSVCGGSIDRAYLPKYCRRVSECEARAIHPAMFDHLAACARMDTYYDACERGVSCEDATRLADAAAARVRTRE